MSELGVRDPEPRSEDAEIGRDSPHLGTDDPELVPEVRRSAQRLQMPVRIVRTLVWISWTSVRTIHSST